MSNPPSPPSSPYFNLTVQGPVYVVTLTKKPENKLNKAFCQSLIALYRHISTVLVRPGQPGVIITRGSDHKFWCTGVELADTDKDPYADNDGFYPLLYTLLDCPLPTIALLTGHTMGGGCLLALAHDYRVMNADRGFISLPPLKLGIHFPGIGALPKAKLRPQVARRMLLEADRWTGKEALADGIVDEIAIPDNMLEVAVALGQKIAPKAETGVYGVLRSELLGEAIEKFQRLQWAHSQPAPMKAKAKY